MNFEELVLEDQPSLIEDIKRLISIKSVNGEPEEGMPFGAGPAEALRCFLEMGQDFGFTTENFGNYAGHIDYDPTIDEHGVSHATETIGIVGHVDVVDAGEGWICKPFEPEIIDGILYGRGTVDDKGPMVTCLHALKLLRKSGIKLNKKIRIIAGTDEECGNRCLKYYFGEAKVPAPTYSFTPDATFPIKNGEMGVSQYQLVTDLTEDVVISGGMVTNAVPEFATATIKCDDAIQKSTYLSALADEFPELEKSTGCTFMVIAAGSDDEDNMIRIDVTGRAAHALALQNGHNAISALMAALAPLQLGGELGRIVSFYNDKIGLCIHAEKMADIRDEVSGPITFNVGTIAVQDGKLILGIDNRCPISYTCKETQDIIEAALEGTGFRMENRSGKEAIYINEDTFLVKTLSEAYRKASGDYDSKSVIDGTCTYARCVENCVSYGPILPGQENRMHADNEYVAVDKLVDWLKIYTESIYQLAK